MIGKFDDKGDLWIAVALQNAPIFPSAMYSGTTGDGFGRINLTEYVKYLNKMDAASK